MYHLPRIRYDNQNWFVLFADSISLNEVKICVLVPLNTMRTINLVLILFVFVMFLVMLALLLAKNYFVNRNLSQPIMRFTQHLQEASKGNLIPTYYGSRKSIAELTTLLNHFNEMSLVIKDRKTLFIQLTHYSETERKLDMTLRSISDAIITTDINGLIEMLNPKAEQLLGVSKDLLIDTKISDSFQLYDSRTEEVISSLPVISEETPLRYASLRLANGSSISISFRVLIFLMRRVMPMVDYCFS